MLYKIFTCPTHTTAHLSSVVLHPCLTALQNTVSLDHFIKRLPISRRRRVCHRHRQASTISRTKNCIIRKRIKEKKLLRAHFFSAILMEEPSFFDKMMMNLRATCKYYTGFPKDLGPSRLIHFTSEREFVQLLHQGYPVVVAFTIKCNLTKHLDKVLEEAAVEFYPHVKFMRVECPKYPGFCITRQKKEYPFIEIFHSPGQAINQGTVADPNITKYAVQVLPFNYDISAYGFREFFKRHGIRQSSPT